MNIKNYNQQLKEEYRTLVVAVIRAIENNSSDTDRTTEIFANKVRELALSDKQITTSWFRARAYRADLYQLLPEWMAKAAYACLLDMPEWKPGKDEEWFAMIGLFIREMGGKNPSYNELVDMLPPQINTDTGRQWLASCIDAISTIQDTYTTAKASLFELSDCPRQSLCMQFMFLMNLCDYGLDHNRAERKVWNGQDFYEYHSLRSLLKAPPVESNGAKALAAMQAAGLVERLRLTADGTQISEGDRSFQRSSVRVYWRLTEKTKRLLNPKQRSPSEDWATQSAVAFSALHQLSELKRQSLCMQFLVMMNLCRYEVDKGIVIRKSWGENIYYSFHSLREQLKDEPNAANSDKALVDMQSIGLVERLKLHDDGTRIAEGDNSYQRRAVSVYWTLTHTGKLLFNA